MTGPREVIELDEDPFAEEGEGGEGGSVYAPDTTGPSTPEIGVEDEDIDFDEDELEDDNELD